ncbi:MAG: TonB-dependent receptor plug domain-containing protein [Gemmatimonadales bacterium]
MRARRIAAVRPSRYRVALMLGGLAALPNVAGAQAPAARIAVHVTQDTVPIANALVRAGASRATTDASGDAVLRAAVGAATLVVTKIGFHPDTTTLYLRGPIDTSLVVHLVEQPETVAPIFVTSTRTERRLEQEPLRIEVLGGDDVSEKSEMRPADSRTLLSEMSGVRIQTLSPLGATNVRLQGLPGRYTAVLNDGLPLYGGQASAYTLVDVVPLDLRQVEVIKGAASALYGAQALSGVVNLISRRPPDTTQVLVNQSAPLSTDAMTFIAGSLGRSASMTVLAGLHRQSAADNDHDGWTDVAGLRRAEARSRLFLDDSARHTMMITVGGFAEDRAAGTAGQTPSIGPRTPFVDSLSTRHADIGLVGDWRTTGPLSFAARVSASDETRRHRFGDVTEPDWRRTFFGEATATRSLRVNLLIVGGALLKDVYANAAVPRFDAVYSTPGLFVQDTYSPLAWASATVNGRCDRSSLYGTICTPRLSLLVGAPAVVSARISVGSGWFAPRPLTEQTESFGLSRLFVPAPLAAERARTASFDVTATRGPLQLNGTMFANRVANPLGLQTIAGDTTGAVNLVNALGPLEAHGGEVFAVFNREPFVATAYYAATRSRELSTETGKTREAPFTPREAAGIDFAVEDDESGAYAALEVFYTGRQALEDDPYATISRPYTTVGVLVADRWKALKVFLNAENLTNVRQTAWQPIVRTRVGEGGSWTVEPWAPLEGRRLNAGARWHW